MPHARHSRAYRWYVLAHLLAATSQWGTVADWVQAIGTVLAFFGALRLLQIERDRRNEEREDRKLAHVRLVAAWIERTDNEADGQTDYYVTVVNGSELPASVSFLIFWPHRFGGTHWNVGMIRPKDSITQRVRYDSYPQAESITYQRLWNSMHPALTLYIGVAGRAWRREHTGELIESIDRTPAQEATDWTGTAD